MLVVLSSSKGIADSMLTSLFFILATQINRTIKKMKNIRKEITGNMFIPAIVSKLCLMNFSIIYFLSVGCASISLPNRCKYAIKAIISLSGATSNPSSSKIARISSTISFACFSISAFALLA